MKIRIALPIIAAMLLMAVVPAQATVYFADDFEDGTLDAWQIVGRQEQGTNIADVVTHSGSLMGHVYKTNLTEVGFQTEFAFDANLRFRFDMEAHASSFAGPTAADYADGGVHFAFIDHADNVLGYTTYRRTTSTWPVINNNSPTYSYNVIPDDAMYSYNITMSQLLAANPGINPADIATVWFRFVASASGTYETLQGEVFVDNVIVTPEPASGIAIVLGVILVARRRNR